MLTITGDNGSEFAYHEKISKALNADFYFAHPYSSWERGLNENTNGLKPSSDKILSNIMIPFFIHFIYKKLHSAWQNPKIFSADY